jgi:hypothetical protein
MVIKAIEPAGMISLWVIISWLVLVVLLGIWVALMVGAGLEVGLAVGFSVG